VQVIANGPHQHLPRVEADANLHLEPMPAAHLRTVAANGLLHGECRIARPHRVIFMRDRRPEQGHDAIAHHPVDRALVAMDRRHHPFQHGIEELPRLLRIAIGD
jgi:hypothetical protein